MPKPIYAYGMITRPPYPNYGFCCDDGEWFAGVQRNTGGFERLLGPYGTEAEAAADLIKLRNVHQKIFEAGGYLDELL
jgi:hypothetical protein